MLGKVPGTVNLGRRSQTLGKTKAGVYRTLRQRCGLNEAISRISESLTVRLIPRR